MPTPPRAPGPEGLRMEFADHHDRSPCHQPPWIAATLPSSGQAVLGERPMPSRAVSRGLASCLPPRSSPHDLRHCRTLPTPVLAPEALLLAAYAEETRAAGHGGHGGSLGYRLSGQGQVPAAAPGADNLPQDKWSYSCPPAPGLVR